MLDSHIRPIIDRPLTLVARLCHKAGLQADQITLAGFIIGIIAGIAIIFGFFLTALCLILLSRMLDGLDGTVARLTTPTDKGAFLDIALDFIFYSFIPLSFALNDASHALAAAFLIFTFVGTGTSFLAYASIAEKRGIKQITVKKGLFYLGGLTEGTETIAILCAFCIWPDYFTLLAIAFGVLCILTTIMRLYQGVMDFE